MRLRVAVYFMRRKMCKLDGDCTEEDVNKGASLERRNEQEQCLRCLRNCTNSNPTFVGVLSLNLENHLLPTFQKCFVFFTH